MASTYSPKLRFELIGAGEQAGLWGTTTNKNVGQLIEQAIAGVTTADLTASGSGTYTLTALDGAPDQSRSAVILCTGTPSGAVNVVIPTQTKLYVFRNECGRTITVKTAAQTGGVALLNGEATLVFCDGTDAVLGLESAAAGTLPVSAGGTGASTFTGGFIKSPSPYGTTGLVSSLTVNAASELANEVPVLNGGSGRASATAYSVICGGTSSTGPHQSVSGLGASGQVLTSNGAGALPTWQSVTAAGVNQVTAGTGINVSPTTGNVVVTNTGVTSVSNGSGINVSASTGSVVISSTVNPSDYVTTSGTQSVSGQKTFTSGIEATGGVYVLSAYHNFNSSGTSMYWNGSEMRFDISSSNKLYIASASAVFALSDVQKPGGGPFNATSDSRIKENVVPYTRGLAAIEQLNPVDYNYNNVTPLGADTNYKTFTGLIAQQVEQTAFADMVSVGSDGYLLLDTNELTYALINSVKELSAQVKTLQAEVAALKGA